MNYFICYDISNDRIRTRVAKALERLGLYRVQKSVFFAKNFKPYEIHKVCTKLELLMEEREEGDGLLLLPVEGDQLANLILVGENEALEKLLGEPPIRFF